MKKLLLIIFALFAIQAWTYSRVNALESELGSVTREAASNRQAAGGRISGNFRDQIPEFDSLVGSRGLEILVFNTNCPACEHAAPAWQALAQRRGAEGYGFALLASREEGANDFLGRHGIFAPRIASQEGLLKRLHVLATPSTIVLRPDGTVEAMGTLAMTLAAKRSSWEETATEWPKSVRDAWIRATAMSAFGEFTHMQVVALGNPERPVHVFESDGNIVGFAAIIRKEYPHEHSSSLEAWVMLDSVGRARGVLPLRQHRDRYHLVQREQLERWSCEDLLAALGDDSVFKGVFLEELRRLRVDLGFTAKTP